MSASATISEFAATAPAAAPKTVGPEAAAQSPAFAILFAATFCLTIGLFYLVNILGNGTGLFDSKRNPSMFERAWKMRRVAEKAAAGNAPQVIVLGSSRSMQIRPIQLEYLTGKRAFNYGVSVSNPLDYLTQLRYLLSINARPEMIVIGVDENAFSSPSEYRQYDVQLAGHWGLLRSMPFPESVEIFGTAIANITPATTWDSAADLLGHPDELKLKKSTDAIIFGDGYLIYRLREADRAKLVAESQGDKEKLRQSIRSTLSREIRSEMRHLVPMSERDGGPRFIAAARKTEKHMLTPDPRQWELFEQFLSLAQQNGIEVRIMLLPLHPAYVKDLFDDELAQMRRDLAGRIAAAAGQHGCTFRDFSDLAGYGGSTEEFWDPWHQTPANMQRMVNKLFDKEPEAPVPGIRPDLDTVRALEVELARKPKKGNPPPTVSTLTIR